MKKLILLAVGLLLLTSCGNSGSNSDEVLDWTNGKVNFETSQGQPLEDQESIRSLP